VKTFEIVVICATFLLCWTMLMLNLRSAIHKFQGADITRTTQVRVKGAGK